ncbi:MAG: hypothetical protein GWO88_00650 [Planctomycetia bacterium]|nr:hypothetical protein [Planctomycetia bacterium]
MKRRWSLAERLAAGIGLALLVLSLILGFSGYVTLSKLFESNLQERAESQARQLALFAADAILVYDYGTLERYVKALADEPSILSVSILRNDGEVLAQSQSNSEITEKSIIEVSQNLLIGQSNIGSVQLAVDRQAMEESLQRMGMAGLVVLITLIVVLFWVLRRFVDRGLIRPVQQLARAANPLNSIQCPEPADLPKELQRLAQTFRDLCSEIKTHLKTREHAEQIIRETTARLTHEQRLATVGQMAAGLAHNLNTPLGSIKGYGQLLSERLENTQQKYQAELIVEQAEACANTVRNLLTAVRTPEVEQRPFELYQQVSGTIELVRPLLHGQGTTVIEPEHIKDAKCLVSGDPGGVEQILFNLLTNAAQAGATEVVVTIKQKKDKYCVLLIADNGPGIKPVLRNTLFDPFVTDKYPGEGTGLGLFMSQKLATDMGAELVLSEVNGESGATFELRFNLNQ